MPLPTPTLTTDRLRLRPVADRDADALYAMHSSAHVLRYWDSPPWTDRARADRFVAMSRRLEEEGTGARVAIDRMSDGAFVGWCGLFEWNPDFRSATLGWAFDTLPLNRVQSETDTRNAASARILKKLGFVHEGTLREDCVVNGDVSDSWVFGLLRRDWAALDQS